MISLTLAFHLLPLRIRRGVILCHAGVNNVLSSLPRHVANSVQYLSTDKNGFRYGLRNQLVADGALVNMIGSLQTGSMIDNDVRSFTHMW